MGLRSYIESATIVNGGSLSSTVGVGGRVIVSVVVPTMNAAALTFQGSHDGVTFFDVYNSDGTTETQIGASAGLRMVEAPTALVGLPFVKIRSGTAATPIAQSAERTLRVISK